MKTLCERPWWCAATQTTAEIASRSSILTRPESPSERRWRSLIRSSRKPIAPQASIVPKIVSAGTVLDGRREEGDRRREHDQDAAHRRRPLLDRVVLGPLLADRLAERVAAQEVDEERAREDRDEQRDERRDEDVCHLGP